MTSTVRNMDLEGVPLRRTLQLLLKQLDLIYFVEDGILYITSSADSEDRWGVLGPAIAEPSPILQKAEKAKRGEMSLSEMKELVEYSKPATDHRSSQREPSEEKHETPRVHRPGKTTKRKQDREQMNLLIKEMRELIEAPEGPKAGQESGPRLFGTSRCLPAPDHADTRSISTCFAPSPHRAGSMAPASQTMALATAQPIA